MGAELIVRSEAKQAMKGIFNRIVGFSAVAIFVVLIAVFILNLRQEQASSTDNMAGQSGYPPPNNAVPQPIAYPGPSPRPPGELATSQSQNLCGNLGAWITYTNTEAGYSLQYPAESQLRESTDFISITLRPSCYDQQCSGSNRVIISVLENPEELALEEFIMEEFQLASAPQHNASMDNFQTGKSQVELAGTQSLRIEDGVTLNKPDIFITHQEKVIWIYVAKASNVPPHDPPCGKTLELLDEILTSVELLSS
jgi:hypothetical protein